MPTKDRCSNTEQNGIEPDFAAEQASFERVAATMAMDLSKLPGGFYVSDETQRAWSLWIHRAAAGLKPTEQHHDTPELTDDLREIFGRPNFACHHIAKALRLMGHTIANKSEDEQAVVINWLLGHYLKHGADWRQRASDELKAASEAHS